MLDSDSTHCNHNHHHHHSPQLENSSSAGLVSSSEEQALGLESSQSPSSLRNVADNSCSTSEPVEGSGAVEKDGGSGGSGCCSLFPVPDSCRHCSPKMLTGRVLVVLLLATCLILSFIIPVHLIPTASSEYPPPPDYSDNVIPGSQGDSHQMSTGDDGFDKNNMMDDQPMKLSLKSEIMNLVEPFDIPSQPVPPPPDSNSAEAVASSGNGADVTQAPAGDDDKSDNNGNADGDDGDDDNSKEGATSKAKADSDEKSGESGNGKETAGDGDADGTENQVEDAVEAEAASQTESDSDGDSGTADATSEASKADGSGESCSSSKENNGDSGDASMKDVLAKIESLMDAVKNIDLSIDKMETLVQSTMIDERVYKCMSAITNGNQTQAVKYWKQILKYLSTPQKQAAIMNQLIRDSYGGSEEHIQPVIQFISLTQQYYGYFTLFNELPKHDHLYRNTAIFTLGHHVKKSCGRDSALYKSLPSAVQNVFADFFTLQNKHNKGYLYYAKRCVAKHYSYCLDVLTKRIDPYELDGLAEDSEEKKRYHWKLNATDSTNTKFFFLNHDKYWTYRLQDLNNSPRFKMEEAGSNAEVELAHFQLKLHTDDEIMIQLRDSEDYLEEEDFKSDKAEVRLHSFHQADGIPDSPRMFWLVKPVTSANADDGVDEPDSCNTELASATSANGNGNGNSK